MSRSVAPKVAIIVQARMGSSRLPGKVMRKAHGKALLHWLLERLDRVGMNSQVIIATTENPQDDAIVQFCEAKHRLCIRGSENDVLSRFAKAADHLSPDIVVRITADCPLMDPAVIQRCLAEYLHSPNSPDYVSNVIHRSYPRGMDVEVFSASVLYRANAEAANPSDREHVTPYIYRNPSQFKIGNVIYSEDQSKHRWTVDTPEDFQLIDLLLGEALKKSQAFTLEDLLEISKAHPDWSEINRFIEQKSH